MSTSNNNNPQAAGRRPPVIRLTAGPPSNPAQGREAKGKKTVSAPAPNVTPKLENNVRVYKPEELTDRATVEAAINDHIIRAREQSGLERLSVAINYINGSTFIAFNGTESLVLTSDELIDLVLADKFIAAQLCVALALTPIPLSIVININSNTTFSTTNRLQAPTIAECEATKIEDLKNIYSSFHFKQLSSEVRKMIYLSSDVFALGHDGQIPPFFLVALCDSFLQEEAKAAYKEINFQVTLVNEKSFNKMSIYKIRFLRHLYCQWGDLGKDEYKPRFLQLRGNRCQMSNNLRTLTMDFSSPHTEPSSLSLMCNIARASNAGVVRLTIRLQSFASLESRRIYRCGEDKKAPWLRLCLIEQANEWIRSPGRLISVNTTDCMEEWFWERADGNPLDVSRYGKAHLKTPSVKCNMALENRILGRTLGL
ncbi:hypothetical protein BKA64DRAFT_635217 [Cadophora sp. MPI-SDFR-AT-0126]|nr:hypothetical protein BKA64DRAFT_635217 [Leotiomycetes sp. MPI-SDFR-AT-0126]